jgi:hypothetical protein
LTAYLPDRQLRDRVKAALATLTDLDHEIRRSGLRGNADPGRPRARRRRSTRRRQDAPDLPKRKIKPAHDRQDLHHPGRQDISGHRCSSPSPARPTARCARTALRLILAPTTTSGPPGMHHTSPPCSTGSSRTCAVSSATTCSTSPPSSRRSGWPRTFISPCAAPSPAPSCGRSSSSPTTKSVGPRQITSGSRATACLYGMRHQAALPRPRDRRAAHGVGRRPGRYWPAR